ncbi:uncharacterized protein EV420DRAFT_1652933 [Desarmillaria tabescens]|uniref:Uncharacterized protein n=1 Tax=Armillaria tabescens TaxID=1929756 RepID=A0AA39J4A0_ARMTA|nr:uncharacterized protein EV420DRAFT_1652933 [Desarmillaria tabescens]KAK0435803.1 hypothetical protein EV420DRAFT_1652933 [Desarmillaria tabescens]
MKYTSKTIIAPCLLLHRAIREDSSDSGKDHESCVDVDSNSEVSEYSVSDLSPVSEVSQGVRRHSSDQHDFDSSASESSETPVSDHWTASEFCQGFQNRNAESESAEWCSQGSGDKSSTAPLDEDVTAKLDPVCKLDPYLIDGSILPDTTRASVLLSLLCVGTPDTIWGMLASTLYQRHVWKMKHPAMGIIIAPAWSKIQLVIAWLDKSDIWNDLPSVHAVCIATLNHPSGVFDLQNPVDSLSFILILFRLHSYFHELQSTYDAKFIAYQHGFHEVDALEWRSDHAPNAIPACRLLRTFLIKAASQPATTSEGASLRQIKKRRYVEEQTSTEAGLLPIALGERLLMAPLEGIPGDSDDDLSESDVRSKRYSASSFATAHHRTGKTTDGCVYSWMYWRGIKLDIYPSDICEQNQVTQMYKRYTDLYQLPTLFTGAQSSDPAVQAELDVLKMNLDSGRMRFQSSNILPDPIGIYLKQKMELILTASRKARDMKASVQRENIPEAEARSTWDMLLGIASDIHQDGDIHFHLERMIKLPRNDEYSTSLEVVEDLRIRRSTWTTDTLKFARRACEVGGEEGSWLSAIAHASTTFLVNTRVCSPTPNLAPKEPKQAKCDNLVTLTCHIFPVATMTTAQWSRLKKFSLVTQPTREKTAIVDRTPISSASKDDYRDAFNKNAIIMTSRQQVTIDCKATEVLPPSPLTPLESPFQVLHISNNIRMDQDNSPGLTASVPSTKDVSIIGTLMFVLCINENKKFLDQRGKNGVNQSRMGLVACLKFLAAIGITNFPVYSVITDGTLGTIVSAHMKDCMEGVIYEHNVRTFDISNPVDALNVATFIMFIAMEHAQVLHDLLSEQKLQELAGQLDQDDPSLHWTMEHQFPAAKKSS